MSKLSNNRFFLAFIPEKMTLNKFNDIQCQLNINKGARLVPFENLHITLVFLGAVDKELLNFIAELSQDIYKLNLNLERLYLDKFIYWKRSKVAGIAASSVPKFLFDLHKYFTENLINYDKNIFDKVNNFNKIVPHVTLVRNAAQSPIFPALLEPIEFSISKIYLMQSNFTGNSVSYSKYNEWEL